MNKVRIGIIGIGNIGSAHALNIFNGKIKGLELTALCDIDPNRFKWAKNTFGMQIPLYSDYRLLLNSGLVDAILIATPHSLHPFIAMDGFRANLHVLTEKPAGIDTFHVRQMNKAAKNQEKYMLLCIIKEQIPYLPV